MQDSGFRVQGAGFMVHGSGFRVRGSGFRVRGAGSRVQGAGVRVRAEVLGLRFLGIVSYCGLVSVLRDTRGGVFRGSLAHEKHLPPQGRHRALGIFLLYGTRRGVFLMSEVPL